MIDDIIKELKIRHQSDITRRMEQDIRKALEKQEKKHEEELDNLRIGLNDLYKKSLNKTLKVHREQSGDY